MDLTYGIVQPGSEVSNGVPILRVKDIQGGHVDTSNPRRVDTAVEANYERSRLRGGELLITLVGTVGEVAVAGTELAGWNVARAIGVVRLRPEIGARWVSWVFRLPETVSRIAERVNTTVQTTLNLGDLREILIPIPPSNERRWIAAALSALDDKIESSRRVIQVIPDLIRAKVSASLLSESESVSVADLAEFVNGGAYTKGASGTGRIVIRIAELNSGPGGSTVYNDIDVPDNKTARSGDILMAWSGSLGVYRWVLAEAIVNQHIFKVIPAEAYPAWLVFDRLDQVMPTFRGIAKDKATTMGHIQRGHLTSTNVDVPLPETIKKLDGEIAPLWERLLVAEQENLTLAALRDALLPELLSGRIRVPEAQEAVAEVSA